MYVSVSKDMCVKYFIMSTTGTIRLSYAWIWPKIESKTTEGMLWVILPRSRPYILVFSLERRRIIRFVSSAVRARATASSGELSPFMRSCSTPYRQ